MNLSFACLIRKRTEEVVSSYLVDVASNCVNGKGWFVSTSHSNRWELVALQFFFTKQSKISGLYHGNWIVIKIYI